MGFRPSTQMDVRPGTAGDAWNDPVFTVDFTSRFVSIIPEENDLDVSFSNDGTNWLDTFKVLTTAPIHDMPFSARKVRVKNSSAGDNSDYQVIFTA